MTVSENVATRNNKAINIIQRNGCDLKIAEINLLDSDIFIVVTVNTCGKANAVLDTEWIPSVIRDHKTYHDAKNVRGYLVQESLHWKQVEESFHLRTERVLLL